VRILLVEDDPLNIELFEAALESEGHQVTVESDGVAGEARGLLETFDLILLDVMLPRRNGLEVCRTLREAGVRTPIVALSASVLRDEIARTTEAGFTQFIAKPIAPHALRAAVRGYDGSDPSSRTA
jgi:DNA-binding response OmpR family regulator